MSTAVREQAQADRHDDEPPPAADIICPRWSVPLRALPFIFGDEYDRVVNDLDWGIIQSPGAA